MPELDDYSGEFDPKFSHDKFSKETLLELLKAYSEYIRLIDGSWYVNIMKKWGNEEAFDCDMKVWEKGKFYEIKSISNVLNIHGNDVATVMKYLQVFPWIWLYDCDIDIINNNYATLTYRKCPILFSLEKEGKGRERQQCYIVCPNIISFITRYFNSNIEFTPLKLPPRQCKNDICCQWEFKLEK